MTAEPFRHRMSNPSTNSTDNSWAESSVMDLCQSFIAQLPEEQQQALIEPILARRKTQAPPTPASVQPAPVATAPAPPINPDHATKENERSPRNRKKASPNGRLKTRMAQSGSRKRRQIDHADTESESGPSQPSHMRQNGEGYATVPIFVQNSLSVDIKENPKKLHDVLKQLKPEASLKSVSVCKSGDIKIIATTPHDENMLRQPWPHLEAFGQFKPRLPKEKTANHEATILNIPTCITNIEINEQLSASMLSPKDIYRFNKKGTQEPSRNVKVTFGSKREQESLISHGFSIYSQHFKVVENKPPPKVIQCFKCQKFGHNFYECKEKESTCLRCGGDHRHSSCSILREQAKCANCSGNHAANFKGCPKFREAQKSAKEVEESKKGAPTYAAKVTPSIQLTPKSILACLADCLSELVSLIKDSIENKKPLNDLAPFKIVSLAASRHMNVNFDANDILLGVISPTPASSPEKSLAPSQSQSGSPEISPSIQMQLS